MSNNGVYTEEYAFNGLQNVRKIARVGCSHQAALQALHQTDISSLHSLKVGAGPGRPLSPPQEGLVWSTRSMIQNTL